MVNQSNHQRVPQLRCINDLFGYCSGEPDRVEDYERETYIDLAGTLHKEVTAHTRCSLDPKTCPYYITHCELITRQLNIA
ncbi:hypothetical protein ES703_41279 [subsurface metagenome]